MKVHDFNFQFIGNTFFGSLLSCLEPLKDVAPKKLMFMMPTFYKEHTFSKCTSHYQAPEVSQDRPSLAANLKFGIYNGEMGFNR